MDILTHKTFRFDIGDGHYLETSDERAAEWIRALEQRAERAEAERDALRERIVGMEEGRRLAGGSSHD